MSRNKTRKRILNKSALKRFVIDTIWSVDDNANIDRPALCNMINERIDVAYQPLDDWITEDGSLHSVIEVVEDMLE